MTVTADTAGKPFLSVRDLGVRFVLEDGTLPVVNGVSFDVHKGETLCLLGESGSGKSVTTRSLMRLHPPRTPYEGSVSIDGLDILNLPRRRLSDIRGALVSMIFQEPMTALDPVFTIGQQIIETVREHDGLTKRDARRRALELLDLVQIPSPERRLLAYPHELSGGLRQRAMIAVALSCRPKLLLADEPTTALDATVQMQILLLIRELQRELGMTMILVTHDLGVAAEVADRVAVMYLGKIVELAKTSELFSNPLHPYTRALLSSVPKPDPTIEHERIVLQGDVPSPIAPPEGCSFHPRCPLAVGGLCDTVEPRTVDSDGHQFACHVVEEELGIGREDSA